MWWLQPASRFPLRGVSFADAVRGWTVGAFGSVLHTPDGGVTWRAQGAELGTLAGATLTAVQVKP